ncbi:MAG: tripartite tricarboxylate transporter permease, partial [Deferrisomatales bacterium]|nr:tripartite tricarboxylate transporter permease [Deferrisomatales bacterium]
MLEEALPALMELLIWPGPLFLVLGSTLGLVFGILPGLGGPQVLALLLPVTYGMETSQAIVLLIGAMSAVPFGGSITAILINTPGTGCSAATTFDGFPMARQGRAGVALGAAATASCLGGLFGAAILTVMLPIGKRVVLAFSYPEYFMLALMGLSVIAVVSQGSLWKGLIGACIGLMVATIGYDPVTGSVRFAFGSDHLWDGIGLVPAFIGLFAVGEALDLFLSKRAIAEPAVTARTNGGVLEGIRSVFTHFGVFLRCSVVGTLIGIIPGVGGAVANFLAYGHAVQSCKDPEKFGTGDVRGVIAPEAANNAKDGGALVPTLIFGIPGSIEMAVLLGALVVLGLEPGPRMMIDNPHVVLVLVYTLAAGNIICAVMGLLA